MRRVSRLAVEQAIERMDRSELITTVRELRQQRSTWEQRMAAAIEREELARDMVGEMSTMVNTLFKREHDELNVRAEGAHNLIQQMNAILRKAEEL